MPEHIPTEMPQIRLGDHFLSRLILGANPINGGSHLSRFVNLQMKRYFTPGRILELLHYCQKLGINTWQGGPGNMEAYRTFREQGGQLHFISLAADTPDNPDLHTQLASEGVLGIAHHGERTDQLWKSGKIDHARGYCKKIRDAGTMVGVSTHMPAVMAHILSEDWDVDFFMCCVYERHRTREELKQKLGDVPIPVPEVYLEGDPPRMFEMMRQTSQPCLAFKILAAGRLCDRQEWVEDAFEASFRQMKPNDAVILGMYPEYEDQVAINAKYVARFSSLSGT